MSKSSVVRRNIGGARNASRSEKTKSTHIMDNVVGCTDMVLLDPLDEESIMKNLKARFNAGEIYTYMGNVVISINPCRELEIYSPYYIAKYRSSNMFELPPHVYAVADEAYRSMRDRNIDQCIIISGESGAGKTEASKLILQYVAEVSGKGEEVDVVKQQLLQSNPVMEAFGNAKTKRNDNSSRFGKYMDIEFDYKGDPVGGVISTYLLEKSRVVHTNPGEGNFHIFFKLLAGTDPDFLEMIHLVDNPAKYKYLLTSDGKEPTAIDTYSDFDSTTKAMEIIGFSSEDMTSIFELLAAILNLGNIEFEGYLLPDETSACKLINAEAAHFACDMFGCSFELLDQCITKRIVETSRDVVISYLSATEASFARDGLSKAIYSRMFKWLVERINDKIKPTKRGKRKCMGVLDIYGFEVFERNRFEQFMINYCNERLQQLFLELTLGSEQDEYVREGIEWVKIEYFDNEAICKMIEDPHTGIIAVLNEECLRPGKTSDKTFLERLNQIYHNHDHYVSRASEGYQSDTSIELEEFQLVHYAGTVTYNTLGFMEKNHDRLHKELLQAMYACERSLLKTLFKDGNPKVENLKRLSTTGQNFKASVAEMMKNLQSKNPHYVRCIKPNDDKQPRKFEGFIVRSQVRYMNMLENIKVQRTGYAFRQSYEEALGRYKMLSSRTWPIWKRRPKDGVKAIMEDCGYKLDDAYSFGRTMIFIRTPKIVFEMEEKRKKKLVALSTVNTKIVRGWLARKKYQRLRNSQITIAKYYHGSKCRKEYIKVKTAAIVLQKYVRGWKVRNGMKKEKYMITATKAANCIRRYYYKWKLYKTINKRIHLKIAIPAAVVIQKYYRGWKVRKRLQGKSTEDAAPIIIDFIKRALHYRFLVTLLYNLPSISPIDKRWPKCSPLFKSTSLLLRNLYHRWRCQLVVEHYESNPRERRKMSEKLKASKLFKRRKTLYLSSVPKPFVSDRLNLQSDSRWSKVVGGDKSEMGIIWADNVRKLNRSDAKLTNRSVVITTTAIYILDTKNYGLQHRISLRDLVGLSLSPHNDHFFILHTESSHRHDKLHPKGDVVLENPNVIECITKLAMIFTETQKRELQVQFKTDVGVQLKPGDNTLLKFQQAKPGSTSPACKKKGNLITVTVD